MGTNRAHMQTNYTVVTNDVGYQMTLLSYQKEKPNMEHPKVKPMDGEGFRLSSSFDNISKLVSG